jgi:hypothetical protein
MITKDMMTDTQQTHKTEQVSRPGKIVIDDVEANSDYQDDSQLNDASLSMSNSMIDNGTPVA